MNRSRTLTIAVVVALVGMLAVPVAATAATDRTIDVEQDPDTGEAVVAVADNETAVENASVTVTAASDYAGNGTYETDANGTVVLPEPTETVSVSVNASSDTATASTQTELVPREDSLDIVANQSSDGSTTVTVTQYDDPVENASVAVDADDAIDGNYTTDANGTVSLEQPADDVNATIVATEGNLSAETVVKLSGADLNVTADRRDDGVVVTVTDGGEAVKNATVEVESGDSYAGTGTYATDADGEVALPLPSENLTIEVTATDDNESATTTADLTVDFVDPQEPFGLAVSQFVSALQNVTVDGPPGQVISEFVTSNNPGNADEAPGQSSEAPGQSDEAPGNADEAPGNADDAPGQSGEAPGNSGDAPGQSDDADDDDGPGASNGNAPDDVGPDSEADGEDEESDAEERDDETEREATEADDEESEDDADDDDEESEDDADNGGSDDAPGNSGNAPGRN
jgi:hypothetical protein